MTDAAWILSPERQPASVATAPALRADRMLRWLRRCGYTPEVCSRFGGPGGGDIGPSGRTHGRGTVQAALNAAVALAATPRVAGRALRERPALVLANTPVQAPALALAKLCLGGRVVAVADVMGLHSLESAQSTRSPLARSLYPRAWRVLERLLLRSADLVFVVNDRHGELVRAIAPGTEPQTLRDCAEETPRLAADGARPAGRDTLNVAFLGALVSKRLDPVLDAWELLGAEPGSPGLLVVGDGPDLAAHRLRVASSPALNRSVTFAGALERPRALAMVAACDAACSDCWSDAGFPAKAFEYMALGLPSLIQDRPQVREVLRHGETALLWGDPGELVGQVRRLAGDSDLRSRLGAAGRRELLAAHTEDRREARFRAAIAGVAG